MASSDSLFGQPMTTGDGCSLWCLILMLFALSFVNSCEGMKTRDALEEHIRDEQKH